MKKLKNVVVLDKKMLNKIAEGEIILVDQLIKSLLDIFVYRNKHSMLM